MTDTTQEQRWVDAARRGDEGAFESLVRSYEKRVFALAARMCGNPEDAAEAAQEAFLAAWQGLRFFRGDSSFSTWLYRLTANACVDLLRREGRHRAAAGPSLDDDGELNRDVPDVTAPSPQEEAERRVPVGTPAVFRGGCFPLGQELICGKSLDDRACFAALLGALELLKDRRLDVDLYVLGSVCEEVDSTGAVTAAYGVVPDLCAAVDVTHGDSPDAPKEKTFPLGKGPVIGVGPNCTRWMEQRMRRKAEELGMAVQTEVMAGHSGTNGWPLQVSREGVATAVLSLPLRYMHTPIEVISRRDLEDLARLLAAFVEGIGEEAESR